MWTFILCLTSTAMYQAAGKTGKKVKTCLRRLTFIILSGIKPAGRNSTADSTCLNFSTFFFFQLSRPCWWCVGVQYNRTFFRIIYMKIGFSPRRRQMLLFLTLTQHQHDRRDELRANGHEAFRQRELMRTRQNKTIFIWVFFHLVHRLFSK